jgi:manganese/zinc-transporting P-type ATPase C
VRWRVAHSVRGRLRVRYPSAWLKPREQAVVTTLRSVPGVRAVNGNRLTGSVRIDYDPFRVAEGALVDVLRQLDAHLDTHAPSVPSRDERRPALDASSAPLIRLAGATSVLALTATELVSWPILTGLILAANAPSVLRAGAALARGRLNGEVLEASTLAVLAARRNFGAAALLTWLRALGDWVVSRTVVTTRRSLRNLVVSAHESAVRRDGEARVTVPAANLLPGDVIVARAGQRLPIDGTIVRGEALVNQQTMTGEALPVERSAGDQVFAGTTIEHGELEIRVDRIGLDTAVGRIVAVVEAAAAEKSDIQLYAERLAQRDVRRTLALGGLGAAVSRSFDAGVAILVADYGMAARVGIPTAIVTSMKRASRQGILMKGPRALEALARVNTVVFDKTGTLTSGTPRIVRVVTYRDGLDENELLRLAAAAERGFRHPVARAIAAATAARRLEPPAVTRTNASTGFGLDVEVEGHRVLVGSRRFMEAQRISLTAAEDDEAAAHAVGAAPTFVAIDGRLAGALVLQDSLRAEAREAVLALRARAMRNVIMLSGDHPEPTRVIAESLGVRHYYAEMLPEDKAALIRSLKAEGRVVAMVGDGANDALALNEADVGMAVPGGAELAVEAADVVILRGGLDRVVLAIDLARDAIVSIRRTLGAAARANLGVVALASFGLARPVTSILLSHGTTIAAAALTAARPEPRSTPEHRPDPQRRPDPERRRDRNARARG